MSLVSREWNNYIDVEPPRGCHFHIHEVDDRTEQLGLSGAWWTGKFCSLSCLLKTPHEPLIINRKTNSVIKVSEITCNWIPESSDECISLAGYVNEVITKMVVGYDLSDPKFYNDDVQTPWDFIKHMGLTHLFHSYLEEASWDDFQEIDGFHKYYPSVCRSRSTQ